MKTELWLTMSEDERRDVLHAMLYPMVEKKIDNLRLDVFAKDPQRLFDELVKVAIQDVALDTIETACQKVNKNFALLLCDEEQLVGLFNPTDERALLDYALQLCRINEWLLRDNNLCGADVMREKLLKSGVALLTSDEEATELGKQLVEVPKKVWFENSPFNEGLVTQKLFFKRMDYLQVNNNEDCHVILKLLAQPVSKLFDEPGELGELYYDPNIEFTEKAFTLIDEAKKVVRELFSLEEITADLLWMAVTLSPNIKTLCRTDVLPEQLRSKQQRTVTKFYELECPCRVCDLKKTLIKEMGF